MKKSPYPMLALALLPYIPMSLIMFFTGAMINAGEYTLFYGVLLFFFLSFAVNLFAYIQHVRKNDRIGQEYKSVYYLVFMFVGGLGIPFYWYKHILKAAR